MKTFKYVLFSVFISVFGTQMSNFALGIWVLEGTQSTSTFALVGFAAIAPPLFFAPILGIWVDRFNHRHLMLLGHIGGATCTSLLAFLYWYSSLPVWAVVVIVSVSAMFTGLLVATLTATTVHLVELRALTRAQGIVQGFMASAQIAAPALAAFLFASIGLSIIFVIDFLSFSIAITVLSMIGYQQRTLKQETHAIKSSAIENIQTALRYLRSRPGLIGLMVLVSISNLGMGMIFVLFTPLILSISDVQHVGIVTAIAGVGMIAGNLVMIRWSNIEHNIRNVYLFCLLTGLILWLSTIKLSIELLMVGAFAAMFCRAVIITSSQSVWQRKVHPAIQGRVFGVTALIGKSAFPAGYILAGPLVEGLLGPWIAESSPFSQSIMALLGGGPSRDIALLFLLTGTLLIFSALVAYSYPRLRKIEKEVSDYRIEELAIAERAV